MKQYTLDGPDQLLLSLDDVRRLLGVGEDKIRELIEQQRFPAPIQLGPKSTQQWTGLTIACWLHLYPMMQPQKASGEDGRK